MHILLGLPLIFIIALMIYNYYYDKKDEKLMEKTVSISPRTKEELALDALITMSLRKEDRDA